MQAQMLSEGQARVDGWGDQKDTNLSLVKRALTHHDPEGHLANLLDTSGQGNNPVVLDFFLSLGKGLQEGGFLSSNPNPPETKGKTAASAMFGTTHPSKLN